MTSSKAIQIAKEIDAARCKGNWIALPELARRYKKHNPDGIGEYLRGMHPTSQPHVSH